jgi:hypothetical protein
MLVGAEMKSGTRFEYEMTIIARSLFATSFRRLFLCVFVVKV